MVCGVEEKCLDMEAIRTTAFIYRGAVVFVVAIEARLNNEAMGGMDGYVSLYAASDG